MNFTINLNIHQEVTELQGEIIKKYWEFDNMEFKNKPSVLKKEYDISQYKLNKIIKNNSTCEINKGGCIECGIELIHNVTSQTQFREKINSTIIHCEECRAEYNERLKKERELNQTTYRNQNLQKALEFRLWEKLTTDEFLVLKSIIKINDRDAIFREVFSQDYQGTWTIVNKLERVGLIDVLRDDSSVIGFGFLEELENLILNFDEKIEAISSVRNNLSFSLTRKTNKFKQNQPDYSGVFVLPSDILLKKGVEYIYGGWIQSDGSINLKFTPKEELFGVTQKDIEQEPEHIKDVISNMFNDLSNKFEKNNGITDFAEFEDDSPPF